MAPARSSASPAGRTVFGVCPQRLRPWPLVEFPAAPEEPSRWTGTTAGMVGLVEMCMTGTVGAWFAQLNPARRPQRAGLDGGCGEVAACAAGAGTRRCERREADCVDDRRGHAVPFASSDGTVAAADVEVARVAAVCGRRYGRRGWRRELRATASTRSVQEPQTAGTAGPGTNGVAMLWRQLRGRRWGALSRPGIGDAGDGVRGVPPPVTFHALTRGRCQRMSVAFRTAGPRFHRTPVFTADVS